MKKTDDSPKTTNAARELAKKSVEARRKKWGRKGFVRKMQEWGKLGGRPRKADREKGEE